jgi:hypothetical protein
MNFLLDTDTCSAHMRRALQRIERLSNSTPLGTLGLGDDSQRVVRRIDVVLLVPCPPTSDL